MPGRKKMVAEIIGKRPKLISQNKRLKRCKISINRLKYLECLFCDVSVITHVLAYMLGTTSKAFEIKKGQIVSFGYSFQDCSEILASLGPVS